MITVLPEQEIVNKFMYARQGSEAFPAAGSAAGKCFDSANSATQVRRLCDEQPALHVLFLKSVQGARDTGLHRPQREAEAGSSRRLEASRRLESPHGLG